MDEYYCYNRVLLKCTNKSYQSRCYRQCRVSVKVPPCPVRFVNLQAIEFSHCLHLSEIEMLVAYLDTG